MVARASNGILYPILGVACCVVFIYMSFGDLSVEFVNTKLAPVEIDIGNLGVEMEFVKRNGTRFVLERRPFYVNGWNSYWLMDQAVEEFSRDRVGRMFETAKKMGLAVCRTWAFNDGAYNALQVSLGRFDERVFKALDRVIAEARKHGVRLLLSFANNLQAFGGKTQYVKWAWEDGIGLSSSNDSFFYDPSIRSYFKLYLKTLLTRKNHLTGIEYRDDPTIFAWELMNEPRCLSDPTGDTLQDWLEEMVSYIKMLDQKHLLTIGLEGFYGPASPPEKLSVNPSEWAGTLGSDFIRNSKIPGIDFASVHIYPDQWFVKHDLKLDEKIKYVEKWIGSHIDDGDGELGKPVMFTEFGLSNKNRDFEHSHRDTFYTAIFDIMYESAKKGRSGAGSFIWQLFVGGMEEYNDDFGIVPDERPSLCSLIRQHSCRLAVIRYGNDSTRWGSSCQEEYQQKGK